MQVLSLLSPLETHSLGGIPPQAIVSVFDGPPGDISVAAFTPSPVFVAFRHETIRAWGPAHKTYTEHGMCVLAPTLRPALIARLPRVRVTMGAGLQPTIESDTTRRSRADKRAASRTSIIAMPSSDVTGGRPPVAIALATPA